MSKKEAVTKKFCVGDKRKCAEGDEMSKTEIVTIKFRGTKKFKQLLVDRIYELLMDENVFEEATKPGCEYTLDCSLVPTEEKEMCS